MTKIEWTEMTWNPVTGCEKVSAGCKHCYAETMHERLRAMGSVRYQHDFGEVTFHTDRLVVPLRRQKPMTCFVNSMSDLFHELVSDANILLVMDVIRMCDRHTFQILTKRSKRMREFMSRLAFDRRTRRMFLKEPDIKSSPVSFATKMRHMHIGVSIEDQPSADKRVEDLIRTPAAVRFVSAEPLLGPADLGLVGTCQESWGLGYSLAGEYIDQVIVGCESGPKARPMDLDWARSIRDQCQDAGVAFFFKQAKIGRKIVKMPELDGKVWDQRIVATD